MALHLIYATNFECNPTATLNLARNFQDERDEK